MRPTAVPDRGRTLDLLAVQARTSRERLQQESKAADPSLRHAADAMRTLKKATIAIREGNYTDGGGHREAQTRSITDHICRTGLDVFYGMGGTDEMLEPENRTRESGLRLVKGYGD